MAFKIIPASLIAGPIPTDLYLPVLAYSSPEPALGTLQTSLAETAGSDGFNAYLPGLVTYGQPGGGGTIYIATQLLDGELNVYTASSMAGPWNLESYHTAALASGWSGAAYYRLLSTGDVELAGAVTGSSPNSDPTIFTMAGSQYQPDTAAAELACLQTAGAYTNPGVQVATNGAVTFVHTAGSGTVTISLDGLIIPVSKP